jgi:hypothetical protein
MFCPQRQLEQLAFSTPIFSVCPEAICGIDWTERISTQGHHQGNGTNQHVAQKLEAKKYINREWNGLNPKGKKKAKTLKWPIMRDNL